jgi:DNA-3-methyladenine glycosylase
VESCSSPARPQLGRAFYDRPTLRVARELLGRELHVRDRASSRGVRLVEVEAYVEGDPASHAFRGRTERNRSMFAPPGTLYVFRIHQVVCANLVTRPGEAVLLRAGAPLGGGKGTPTGPGRLCRFLGITLADDGTDTTESPRIYVDDGVAPVPRARILASPRVGLSRAVDRRLRFSLAGDPWVSRPRPAEPVTAAWPRSSRAAGGSPRTRTTSTPRAGGGTSGVRSDGR